MNPVDNVQQKILVTVPHATNARPPWMSKIDASDVWAEVRDRHNAYDRGVADLAERLGQVLNAAVVKGSVSRLIIDLNRPIDDVDAIPVQAAGRPLDFNVQARAGDLAARRRLHREFHALIAEVSADCDVLIDLHTFDRLCDGAALRQVDIGICAPGNTRFANAVLNQLQRRVVSHSDRPSVRSRTLNVRLDEPYSAAHPGAYVVRQHGAEKNSTVIEVCDDLLLNASDVEAIADLLGRAINTALLEMRASERFGL